MSTGPAIYSLWQTTSITIYSSARGAATTGLCVRTIVRPVGTALREAGKHVDSTNVYRDFFQYLPEAISEELRESADEGHLDPVKGIQQDEWLTRKPTKSE